MSNQKLNTNMSLSLYQIKYISLKDMRAKIGKETEFVLFLHAIRFKP